MTTALRAHHFAGFGPGPKLIVLGAVHGNEIAGTRAIERVLAELDAGQWRVERGSLTLLPVTNALAYAQGTRNGQRNLNRRLRPSAEPGDNEDRIANLLCPWLAAHDVLLDLHTFRSPGAPFVMRGPADNAGTLAPFTQAAAEARLAAHLGPRRIVDGWMDAYAQGAARRRARGLPDADASYGIGTTEYMRSRGGCALTLECGQHADPAAPQVAYRALRQAAALLGLADLPDFEPAPPPSAFECLSLATVIDREHPDDRFARAWTSFDALRAGDLIATRHDGTALVAEHDGRIVFPDPGAQPGREWFYLAVPSARAL